MKSLVCSHTSHNGLMRSILSHQPGLSPAGDLLSNSTALGFSHTLLNFQLSTGKVQICSSWILWYSSYGGTEVNRSKFSPWSSAVLECPGWVETPAEDYWDELNLDLTSVIVDNEVCCISWLPVLCLPAWREWICSSEPLTALQLLFLGCPNGMVWSGLLPVSWLNHLHLSEW